MGEIKERPTVQEIKVRVKTDKGSETRSGVDIDEILRAILFDMKRDNKWTSTAEMARRIGVPQQTLATFMDESGPGTGIETISKVCAALRLSPIDLLQRHERYHPEQGGRTQFADDLVFDRFRAVLDRGEASRLVRVIELLRDSGAFEEVLTAAERILPGTLPARKKGAESAANT